MTDKLRAAAEKAIEALETFHRLSSVDHLHIFETFTIPEAVQALRQALEQPDAIEAAVLAEREACAEWLRDNYQDYKNIADICEAIRARGEK